MIKSLFRHGVIHKSANDNLISWYESCAENDFTGIILHLT